MCLEFVIEKILSALDINSCRVQRPTQESAFAAAIDLIEDRSWWLSHCFLHRPSFSRKKSVVVLSIQSIHNVMNWSSTGKTHSNDQCASHLNDSVWKRNESTRSKSFGGSFVKFFATANRTMSLRHCHLILAHRWNNNLSFEWSLVRILSGH